MEKEHSFKQYLTKKYISFFLFISLDVIFLIFIGYLGFKIYGIYNQTVVLKQEIEQLKNSAKLIKNNKDLLQDNISGYNETLSKLIPETETTEEKMSLSLTIKGSRENIESFLTNYNFYGGRLMTSEEFSYSAGSSDSITFSINLFHSPSNVSSSGSSPSDIVILSEDVAFIQDIQEKL